MVSLFFLIPGKISHFVPANFNRLILASYRYFFSFFLDFELIFGQKWEKVAKSGEKDDFQRQIRSQHRP